VAPDLESVEFKPALDEVWYVFDEPVDDSNLGAGMDYKLIDTNAATTDGSLASGTSVERHQSRVDTVKVDFSGSGGIQSTTEANTARAATDDAPNDQDGNNTADAIAVSGGGETTAPDLVGVTIDQANDLARFRFDEPLASTTTDSNFVLEQYDGGTSSGNSSSVDPNDSQVAVVEFSAGEVEQAVRGTADDGAVTEAGGNNASNALDTQTLSGRDLASGVTEAPDLENAFVEQGTVTGGAGTLRVVYDFDQEVDSAIGDVKYFRLWKEPGMGPNRAKACEHRAPNDPTQVHCQFDPDTASTNDTIIEESVLATVENDETSASTPPTAAVQSVDDPDRENPEGSEPLQQLP
jgi:hypothetical protein